MKGLLVTILRPADGQDCTNGGVTSRVTQAVLCGVGLPEIFEPSDDAPALLLRHRQVGHVTYLHCIPADADLERWWYCDGGNFVYSHDGRFNDICPYPVPVHDRRE